MELPLTTRTAVLSCLVVNSPGCVYLCSWNFIFDCWVTYRKLIVYWLFPIAVEMCDCHNKPITCIQQSSMPGKITDLSENDHSVPNLPHTAVNTTATAIEAWAGSPLLPNLHCRKYSCEPRRRETVITITKSSSGQSNYLFIYIVVNLTLLAFFLFLFFFPTLVFQLGKRNRWN